MDGRCRDVHLVVTGTRRVLCVCGVGIGVQACVWAHEWVHMLAVEARG